MIYLPMGFLVFTYTAASHATLRFQQLPSRMILLQHIYITVLIIFDVTSINTLPSSE